MNWLEALRREVVQDVLSTGTMATHWPAWRSIVRRHSDELTPDSVLNLGDHLSEIFLSSRGVGGRDQASLSGGGAAWEGLVCWYLNLCLIGSPAIVIKKASDTPAAIRDALRVTYSNVMANSESDLVAISLSEDEPIGEATSQDRRSMRNALNTHITSRFDSTRVAVVQCKTNWNDNAQIPMLWDIVYLAESFPENRVRVGTTQFSLSMLKGFKYSFVTVPTQREPIRPGSTAVSRVMHLSGGNYWGKQSASQVAHSIKEIFLRADIGPLRGRGLRTSLTRALPHIATDYDYFDL